MHHQSIAPSVVGRSSCRVVFALLAFVSSAVAVAQESPATAAPDLATILQKLDDRLQSLEARLDLIEERQRVSIEAARLTNTSMRSNPGTSLVRALDQPTASGVELAYLVERVDDAATRVVGLSSENEADGADMVDSASDDSTPSSTVVAEVESPPPFTLEERETNSAYLKAGLLPSRGWRGDMHYGGRDLSVGVHAFIDLEYIDAGPDGSRDGVSTFDNHHANIFLEAQLGKNLYSLLEVEYEHGGETVEIDQAFLEWAVTDWASLTAGRFYTPFGIERFVWYSPTNALVSRPEPFRQIVPGNFYANGVMLSGTVPTGSKSVFTYETAITDGLGDQDLSSRRGSRIFRDNNSSRAVSGRLGWSPNPKLEFGASAHQQRHSTEGDLDLSFFGADLVFRQAGFEVRSEYVKADVEEAVGLDLGQEGYYVQVGYTLQRLSELLPSVTFVTRYDSVDLDDRIISNDDRDFWSVGVNFEILDHLRFKLEQRWGSESGPALDNDTFLTQFVIDF